MMLSDTLDDLVSQGVGGPYKVGRLGSNALKRCFDLPVSESQSGVKLEDIKRVGPNIAR